MYLINLLYTTCLSIILLVSSSSDIGSDNEYVTNSSMHRAYALHMVLKLHYSEALHMILNLHYSEALHMVLKLHYSEALHYVKLTLSLK